MKKSKQITDILMARHRQKARDLPWRHDRNPYTTWVSETMLQQTRVAAVIPYYRNFLSHFPSVADLAAANLDDVYKCWEGLGYYSRARNLRLGAEYCVSHFDGELPRTYADLLLVPGIGPYSAGAILSLAYGVAEPAVDGNVIRVFSRLYGLFLFPDETLARRRIADLVRESIPTEDPGGFNEAIMDLGATVCLPRSPSCGTCELALACDAFAMDIQEVIPLKKKKKENPVLPFTILPVRAGNRYLIAKRSSTGLLADLYEFLSSPGLLTEEEAAEFVLTRLGIRRNQLRHIEPLGEASHVFSHLTWRMTGYFLELATPDDMRIAESDGSFRWASEEEIRSLAFPSALSMYTDAVFGDRTIAKPSRSLSNKRVVGQNDCDSSRPRE